MNVVIFLLLLFGVIYSQTPSLPSWPTSDIHVSIAGSAEFWISYHSLFVYSIRPQLFNAFGYSSWVYQYYNATQNLQYKWTEGPTTAMITCTSERINEGILPPPLEIAVGAALVYSGQFYLGNVQVYNWSIQDNFNGYDLYYDHVSSREPYAVYSKESDKTFYFSKFDEATLTVASLPIPQGLKCIPFAL